MKLTIGIKALNEARHIAGALRSAVEAAAPFGGEVVLADSGSTDATIEIAKTFPVRIVQLADISQRSCGAGAQLAFQVAEGDYFYLLDGDMVLHPGFIAAGIAYLDAHPDIAGVGGIVREMNVASQEYQIRAKTVANEAAWLPGPVDRLDCGGLYRSAAVREAGYFADRNLHAFEEFELAARLRSRGWKLARIDHLAVDHFGHTTDGYRLLWRRMRSGYAGAPGEVLRGAVGRRHLPVVLRSFRHIRRDAMVVVWWALLVTALVADYSIAARLIAIAVLLAGAVGAMTYRRGSLELGLYSVASWNVSALGLFVGFVRARVPPEQPLDANILPASAPRPTNAAHAVPSLTC